MTESLTFRSLAPVIFASVTLALSSYARAADPAQRIPVPKDGDLQKSRELLRAVYGEKVQAATTDDAKKKLVQKLLRDAPDNAQDPPAYYVILQLARNLAVVAQDPELAMDAVQSAAEVFEIDDEALRLSTLKTILDGDAAAKQYRTLVALSYGLAEQALSSGQLVASQRFMDFSVDAAQRGKDAKLIDRLQQRKAAIEGEIRLEEQRRKLRGDPLDAAANVAVGKHICLFDADWQRGSRMLVRGNDAKWKEIAVLELMPLSSPEDNLKLADRLYDIAAGEHGWVRDAILLQASQWYHKAIPELKGLKFAIARDAAERRSAEIGRMDLKPAPPATGEPLFEPDAPFASRLLLNRLVNRQSPNGGTRATERAVRAALYWLAHHQMRDGNWSLQKYVQMCKDKSCTGPGGQESLSGATALGLLPFLAAGQTHNAPGPFQKTVFGGVYWLLNHQRPDGDLSADAPQQMYSHGLAAIALCEVYGLSKDKVVGAAAQKAINFIELARNAKTGGWRYHPGEEGDTSVVGWQFMALKSAQMAGLKVSQAALDGPKTWLSSVKKGDGRFAYQPDGSPTPSMSAVGLLCSQYLNAGRSDPVIVGGAQYLMANQPDENAHNIYYWYYATQVMHNMADKYWTTWNRKMRDLLVKEQATQGCAAGSWDPEKPNADAWGPYGGRVMMTSMAALILEVYYRYPALYDSSSP